MKNLFRRAIALFLAANYTIAGGLAPADARMLFGSSDIRLGRLSTAFATPVVPGLPSIYYDAASEVLPVSLSLSRASAATYTAPTTTSSTNLAGSRTSAASGAPRFDFATSAPSLLVEPAATNTILQSKPTSAAWMISNNDSANTAITYNSAIGADGTQTMALIAAASTGSTTRQMEQDGAALVAGQTNCVSFDVGAAGETAGHVQINVNTTGGLAGAMVVFYTLSGNGSVMVGGDLAGTVNGKTASIAPLPSGLYRVSSCFSAPATAINANVYIGPTATTYATTGRGYAGTVGNGIIAGEVQLEAGPYSTSPIRTTTASVTRSADAVSFIGAAATYLSNGGSYVLERQSLAPGSTVERVYGTGAISTLPTGYRYTKMLVYGRALSASEQSARLALSFDLSNDNSAKTFNAGVNLNLFHGYGPVNPTVAGSSYTVLTDAKVSDLVSFGVKYVRLPIRWEQIDPNRNGNFDANTMSVLDAALAKLYAAGITSLIDIHNSFIFCTNQSNINDASSYHYIANADGVVTQAQYVALMQGLANRYKNNPAVSGIDMMNEPQVTAVVASNAYKAAIPAMRSAGYSGEVIVEVTDSDIASSYYPIPDPANNTRHSHHDYPIAGGASGDYESANAIAQGIPVRTLVNKLRNFQAYVTANGGKGHIGEYAVGLDGTYWTGRPGMLDATLAFARANDWRTTAWDYDGDPTIPDANNLSYLDGGTRPRPQRVVMAAYNDVSVPATAAITGPSTSYRLGTNNLVFDFRGIPAAATTYTFSDGGKGGSFLPASVTLAAGAFNAYVPVVYTAPSSDQTVSLTATNDAGAVAPSALSLVVSGAAPPPAGYTPPTLGGQNPNVSAKWTGTPAFYGVSSTSNIVSGSPTIDATNGLLVGNKSLAFTSALRSLMATTGPATLMVEVKSFSGVSSGNRIVGSNGAGPGAMIYAGSNSVIAYAADGSGGPQASSAASAASPTRIVLSWNGSVIKISVGGSDTVTVNSAAGIAAVLLGSSDGTQDFFLNGIVALAVYNFLGADADVKALSAAVTN